MGKTMGKTMGNTMVISWGVDDFTELVGENLLKPHDLHGKIDGFRLRPSIEPIHSYLFVIGIIGKI